MSKLNIHDFDITETGGFLTPHDMSKVTLPAIFSPIVEAGHKLSDFMSAGTVRPHLDAVPEIDMTAELPTLDEAQKRLLMVHYSFIVQTYVWGEDTPPKTLPRNLAVPYCTLADDLGQFPLLPYSGYTLDNWVKLDPKQGITLENVGVIQNFLDGMDENWFIMIHIEIEAKAGKVLAAIPDLLEAVDNKDEDTVEKQLATIAEGWSEINPVFWRMPERCDPYIYYHRVRPYIHGWKDNPAMPEGLIYEGVDKYQGKPQAFRGQTGSQSSIVPTMDALFGVVHEQDALRDYLDELHAYRPVKHRLFIEEVKKRSQLRDFVMTANNPKITELYDACIDYVQKFRTQHLEYAATYINKQAQSNDGNPVDIGTGGTPFMKYLKKHRDETRRHAVEGDSTVKTGS